MKKSCFIVLLACLLTGRLLADIYGFYAFSPSNVTYTTITGTSVPEVMGDDAISNPIDIGFSICYGTNTYSQIKLSSNGYVTLGTVPPESYDNDLASANVCPILAPLWDDTLLQGSAQYLLSGIAPFRVFTVQFSGVKWPWNAESQFNYQVKLCESGVVEFVYGASNGTPANASATIGINMLPGGVHNFWSVTPGNPATASATTSNNLVATWPGEGTKYAFVIPTGNLYDMAALSITGNAVALVGGISQFTVTVCNTGLEDLEAGSYTVKLMNGTVELASQIGVSLSSMESSSFNFSWIPSTTGSVALTGKVIMANDVNPANNETNPFSIIVLPGGGAAVTIGNGSQTARVPVNMFWRNSLFETIYYPDEVQLAGIVEGIVFYNNFVTNLPDMAVNIWMGETTLPDLSSGWIPASQLTQVFSGTVDFPSGQNGIYIPFTVPAVYMGENLVLLVERVWDTQPWLYNPNDWFRTQTVGTNRSRDSYSDIVNFDPFNPPISLFTLSGVFPMTTLLFVAGTEPALTGIVTCGGNPLAGVRVTLPQIPMVTSTNAQGQYTFAFLPAGTYTASFSKPGYATLNLPVTIIAGQVTVLNADLTLLPLVNVTGTVAGSDAPAVGLEGATIALTGNQNYQAITNQQGHFTIPGVVPVDTYAYTISKPGYQDAAGSITIAETNYDMNTILLDEIIYPPGTISGIVSTVNEEPLEGVIVSTGAISTSTGEDGSYSLQVSAGSYSVTATKTGFYSVTQNNIQVTSGEITTVNFSLLPVDNEETHNPAIATALLGCCPNPFSLNTTISYAVKGTTSVKVEIYNINGQKVKTLVRETKAAGNYCTQWNGTDSKDSSVSGGIYFYKMTAGKYSSTKKMILLK